MSVYDKELVINGKAVRSPEQQVYQNMKDIKALQLKIKEAYKCAGELNTASISVAKSLTNAGEDVKEGWLLDTVGNLFSITGGDEDSLLLDFYCSIQGPQGETGPSGATLEIDDSGTSATKVWSSQKVASELAQAGKSYYKHNLLLKKNGSRYYNYYFINNIVNNSDEAMTFSDLLEYLKTKYVYDANFPTFQQNMYTECKGWEYDNNNSTYRHLWGVQYKDTDILRFYVDSGYGETDGDGYTVIDTIFPM